MESLNKQFTLFANFRVAPGNIEAFKRAHRPLWDHCAQEPECLLFDVFQDQTEPGRFRFLEVWSKPREWFETVCATSFKIMYRHKSFGLIIVQQQMTKPYYKILREKSEPLWLEDSKYHRTLEHEQKWGAIGLTLSNI